MVGSKMSFWSHPGNAQMLGGLRTSSSNHGSYCGLEQPGEEEGGEISGLAGHSRTTILFIMIVLPRMLPGLSFCVPQ